MMKIWSQGPSDSLNEGPKFSTLSFLSHMPYLFYLSYLHLLVLLVLQIPIKCCQRERQINFCFQKNSLLLLRLLSQRSVPQSLHPASRDDFKGNLSYLSNLSYSLYSSYLFLLAIVVLVVLLVLVVLVVVLSS
jgi:NADH:ubiquinone oxidoreductase subunit 6 (subunit J)